MTSESCLVAFRFCWVVNSISLFVYLFIYLFICFFFIYSTINGVLNFFLSLLTLLLARDIVHPAVNDGITRKSNSQIKRAQELAKTISVFPVTVILKSLTYAIKNKFGPHYGGRIQLISICCKISIWSMVEYIKKEIK